MTDTEQAIRENERRNRELRGEMIQRARADNASWTPPPPEPIKAERPLDTRPVPAVSAAELVELHRRIDGLAEDMRELAKAVCVATENAAEAFGRQELAAARFEAQVWTRIADLFGKMVVSPAPARSGDAISDLPNPLQGRSSSRVN